jgi:hypothetical protein
MAYTITAAASPAAPPRPPGAPSVTAAPATPRLNALGLALLWLVGASGAVVIFEPSPYEFATLLAIVVFLASGLRLRAAFLPPIALLILINLGYSISAADLMNQNRIVMWILTSWYMAATAVFFAMALSEHTAERFVALGRGLIVGALVATLLGLIGYFGIAGRDRFTLYSRLSGTFKDPNVYGAFVILPALLALQSVVADPPRKALRNAIVFGILCVGVLLAFSRAAWGLLIATAAVMLALMMLTSPSRAGRRRIVVTTAVAIGAMALVIAVLLSLDQVQDLFRERASFDQSYDEGRFGRFGRHVLGAQLALDVPWGIGPLQFSKYFPEDVHNSYLNAFMSGGWLAGVCYPALIFSTVVIGARYLFVRTPWQRAYLAVFATFIGTVGESFIIDTDHWRHYFMLLGLMWGMGIATRDYAARSRTSVPG